jgi:hypothetical protein
LAEILTDDACAIVRRAYDEPALAPSGPHTGEVAVVILGIILLIIGLVASLSILVWIGVLLVVVGLVLNLVPIGGARRRYY